MPIRVFLSVPLLLAGVAMPAAVPAQGYSAVAATDADRLAAAVRRVGASPRDLSALIDAGELSVKVGDATAAAAFFKRAEQIDPNNGRVKAGIARILVSGEHPGEALRYFAQAERTGLPMAPYAADRGLAYDLIGQQERAQRDYRLALERGDDDELRRRYALSLGISGRRDEALKEIDALLRRSDRGAWRARAFILAMNGDVAGANKIAGSMMGGGMAGGLAAFFQRLPTLNAADRAFAVHFGEVTSTPARVADAQLAPALPALTPEPGRRPVEEAAATTTSLPAARTDRRTMRRDRGRVAPVVTAAAPVVVGRPASGGGVTPVPTTTAPVATAATAAAAIPTRPAIAAPDPVVRSIPAPSTVVAAVPSTAGVSTPSSSVPSTARVASAAPFSTTAIRPPVPAAVTAPAGTASAAATVADATPIPGVVPAVTTAPVRTVSSAVSPVIAAATPRVPAAVRPATRPANPATTVRGDADAILARIVANISIPESELAPGPARPAAASGSLDRAARKAERNVAAARGAAKPVETVAVEPRPEKKAPTAAERRAKALADRKAKEDAAAKRLLADKAAAEKKAAKADPPRYWVQVAGGANTRDLDRAWSDAQKKSAALAGRKAFTTPLRATNRVVTGPFKTEAEARAMVNTLSRQGLSAFTFASTAGQKMTPLDRK
ncbi:hypothetical protein ASG29_05230 [Sphingomonas sp. Leaf412]|uniref:SPOR domain-containing protein n=1 Tax=Sphingomonas sp. Leaf412 TaxID=1736370 RepID=UPI0006FD3B1F|nr:SPOR domain-containing protein [Sphingomonas sp. Leaf412]KQT33451.1 hypothetical protein ASG29_05230 [Sphingomonas sp. Leaf412]